MPIDHPDFRRAMAAAGLVPPTELVDDGRIHRCGIEGKKRSNRSGAYSITPDGMFGGMQNWASGSGWESWRAVMPSQLTPAQREAILEVGRQATAKRIAEEKLGHERARLKAIDMWGKAVEGAHPYLDRKGICSNGSRVLGKLLLVPLCDWAGNLHTLQTIQPDGTKLFLKGGSPKGRFHWIRCGQETGPVVYVCEGFATGSTVHAATGGKPVCVAINCGNLGPVCEVLRHHLPKTRIVVCADDDRETPGNPGLTKAMEAARAIRARIAIPRFIGGTDWNDLHQELGIMEARRQLMSTKVPLTVASDGA
jgi:putative DNA primase/helicase